MSLLLCIERRKLRSARDMTPPGLGSSSIGPISLHNAIYVQDRAVAGCDSPPVQTPCNTDG